MRTSQRNIPFAEPTRDELVAISRQHVAAMETSTAEEVWVSSAMDFLLLHTVGRKTGEIRKAALPFWRDHDGCRVVIASLVGSPQHPAWYLNLADTSVNPNVLVRLRDSEYRSVPEVVDGAEYTRIWEAVTADRDFYRVYQERCERRIPIIRLPEIQQG
ncbi:nitroreductase/quinone reductase family protein [Nocardia sp. NPDC059246]|uniref:nitroreductase/quinone reductase family protein n=1 Tax=unclassified Nocardia TaxID=2637762 RepID=UPI00369855F3